MIPKQPPKRTSTTPGLGSDDGIPRLDSAELKKVRDSFEKGVKEDRDRSDGGITPPPSSRARVPREDDDGEAAPRSDRFAVADRAAADGRKSPHPTTLPRPTGSPPLMRQQTAVGLGSKTHPQPHTPPARNRASVDASIPASRRPDRASIDASSPARQPISRPPASRPWTDEAPSGQRTRKPLTVDSVGDAATRIARSTRPAAPKVIASPAIIASAPLDSRSAFVLSLVDGVSDVAAIVDATGMPSDEVIGIMARLARLGLISVP